MRKITIFVLNYRNMIFMRKIECFKIRLLESDLTHLWDICSQKPLKDVLCGKFSLLLNPVIIVADPFLFVYGDRLYLFYEMKRNYSPGVICMISTNDLIKWTESIIVLEENYHLSYPFVFEDSGSVFMIPETSEVGDIRLYKADNKNLSHFSYYKTLVEKKVTETEIGYADSSIYVNDGIYYLVSSIEKGKQNILYLFTSKKLEGPYTEHVCSPICMSSKYGRNGGSLIKDDSGNLYRIAQDCEKRYGDNIHVLIVDTLSPCEYSEHLFKSNLIPLNLPFYKEGGHQLNMVMYKNKMIVATDAKEYHTFAICRLFHKTGLLVSSFLRKIKSVNLL